MFFHNLYSSGKFIILFFNYIGDIEYWKFDDQLKKLEKEISNNPSVRNNSLNYWYTPFQKKCCKDPSSHCETGNGLKILLNDYHNSLILLNKIQKDPEIMNFDCILQKTGSKTSLVNFLLVVGHQSVQMVLSI